MTKIELLIGTLIAIGCAGCTQTPAASTDKTPENKTADRKAQDLADIKALEEHFIAAFKAKDVDTIMSFYVPDESLFVFDAVPPRQYVGAAAYRKDWEGLLGLFPGPIEVDLTDLDITADGGDLAYSHSIQHIVGTTKDGKKLDMTVRVSDGYKRINGKWLITLEHVSVPVDVLTGKADLTSKP